jgi:hypothetical protein
MVIAIAERQQIAARACLRQLLAGRFSRAYGTGHGKGTL